MKKLILVALGICASVLYLNRNVPPAPQVPTIITRPTQAPVEPASPKPENKSKEVLVTTQGFETSIQRPVSNQP